MTLISTISPILFGIALALSLGIIGSGIGIAVGYLFDAWKEGGL